MASFITRNGLFRDPDQLKHNLDSLNEQRNLSQFCDVVLRVCGTQIYAHSNVLAAASPYFGSFLGTGTDCPRMFSQKHPQIIEIHIDTKDGDGGYGEAVNKVVNYMYTSHISLTTTLVCQIIEIAKIMQMERLLEFCNCFQNGEDGNFPCDVATCTTGLQEIAELLGCRSRTIKRVDVATETEESIFKKVEISVTTNLVSASADKANSDVQQNPSENSQKEAEIMSPEVMSPLPDSDKPSESQETELAPSETIGFDTDNIADSIQQKDASLLLAIGNVRPTVKAELAAEDVNIPENIPGSSAENSGPFQSQCATDDCLSNVRTLADMMNIAVEKSGQEGDVISQNLSSDLKISVPDPSLLDPKPVVIEEHDKDKNINLEEISDLVQFDPVTTALLQSSTKSLGRGQKRGRGRWSRGTRGRGRGRGRRPGRPRKVKEDRESDPEFDEFIDRLERGDNVIPPEPDDDNKSANTNSGGNRDETMDVDASSEHDEGRLKLPPEKEDPVQISLWKSNRRRSKPSQLKKDYVMHSLKRRSRKQQQGSSNSDAGVYRPLSVDKKSSESASSGLQFVCQKCDFTSTIFKEYRQHLKSHPETDPRLFVCEKCNFKTTKSREFTTHKQKHMAEDYICFLCEHQSESEAQFQEHLLKHEGDLPYFCTECDSRFKTKNQLIAHKPKHQLEKPFVCAICEMGFKWKHALKNHMVTHSATKDHLCDVCGYATAHKSQLKAHKLIHTGLMFKCPVQGCRFEANKRQNLKYHMVTHTHEKPHQCDICGQSFSLIKNMRRHMLLHTDARPFSCKICSFSTTRYDKLKEHNHKLHNIGEAPVSKRFQGPNEAVNVLNSSITCTYVSTDGITINTEGAISEETLHTIAQLASSQSLGSTDIQGTTINIEQAADDGTVYPIIATVQTYTDNNGEVQYIAEVPQ